MYTVYKITNKVDDKIYIGSSISVEKRWRQHKNNAFNPNSPSYNYPLQKALRKYGIENFDFSILSNNFRNIWEMEEFEHDQIIKFNSINNGYNQTLETHCGLRDENIRKQFVAKYGQKCAKVDKQENIIEKYCSYQEAARKNNLIDSASSIRKVCKGEASSCGGFYFRDLDENGQVVSKGIRNYKNRKPVVGIKIDAPEELIYADSILEASNIYKINRTSIQKCIAGNPRYSQVNGYIWRRLNEVGDIIENDISIDELINQYNKSHPLINGERHSLSEWCRIYGISKNSVYKRIDKGMSVIEAITKPKERG